MPGGPSRPAHLVFVDPPKTTSRLPRAPAAAQPWHIARLSSPRPPRPARQGMSGARAAPHRRVEAERRAEAERHRLGASVAQHHTLKATAAWEERSDGRVALAARARAEAERHERERAELEAAARAEREERRRAEARAEQAAQAARVTPAQRRAALAAHARQLQDMCEAARQAEAEECLAQQFAGGCDLLRTLQSQQQAQAAANTWAAQRAEKQAVRAAAAAEDERALREFGAHSQRLEERYQQAGQGNGVAAGAPTDGNGAPAALPSCPPCSTPPCSVFHNRLLLRLLPAQDVRHKQHMQARLVTQLDQQLEYREEMESEEAAAASQVRLRQQQVVGGWGMRRETWARLLAPQL